MGKTIAKRATFYLLCHKHFRGEKIYNCARAAIITWVWRFFFVSIEIAVCGYLLKKTHSDGIEGPGSYDSLSKCGLCARARLIWIAQKYMAFWKINEFAFSILILQPQRARAHTHTQLLIARPQIAMNNPTGAYLAIFPFNCICSQLHFNWLARLRELRI